MIRTGALHELYDMLTFVGDVGTTESGTADTQLLFNRVRKNVDVGLVDVHTLDESDTLGSRCDLALELFDGFAQKLVRQDEDECCRVLDGFLQVRCRVDVFGKLDSGQVLLVDMCFVDDLGEFSSVDVFFKDPHRDSRGFEQVGLSGSILSRDLGDSGSPVTTPNDCDSFLSHSCDCGRAQKTSTR